MHLQIGMRTIRMQLSLHRAVVLIVVDVHLKHLEGDLLVTLYVFVRIRLRTYMLLHIQVWLRRIL